MRKPKWTLTILILLVFVQFYSAPIASHVSASSSSDDWPMFHHDPSHSGYSSATAPNTNQTLWIYKTEGEVSSSPAVTNGKVYVGSGDHNVYCLNAFNGAHVWNYTTGDSIESSPAVVDDKVYVGSNDNNVYCLDASSGILIWNYSTGDIVDSSPAVANGKVYVGSYDHNVYCFDASNGELVELHHQLFWLWR